MESRRGDKRLFLFFFEQKTAYEIVGCDWSSDVCSSDLPMAFAGQAGVALQDPARFVIAAPSLRTADDPPIGRASCRERV